MLKDIKDRNIWLIDLAIFILGLGYGIALSLLSVYLKTERHFTSPDIGMLAATFALGIVAFSLPMGSLIRKFGARACLVASLFGYAAAVAAFPLMDSFPGMAVVRFVDGGCSVGIWVSCETILLSRSSETNKAKVTSLYAMCMALGYIMGPILSHWVIAAVPGSYRQLFFGAGALSVLAGLLVLLRLDADVPELHGGPSQKELEARAKGEAPAADAGPAKADTPAGALLWRIKMSCLATFVYGYFQASVVLFLPLYLMERKGLLESQTIVIPAYFAAGMLLFTNVAGRLGDRFGHLKLMRWLAVVGTTMIFGFVFLDSYPLMCGAVFVAGASLASISPVSLALQGHVVAPRDYSRANAIYNVFYAAGMLLGPPISSRMGTLNMIVHLAVLWMVFIAASVIFAKDDPHARPHADAEPREPLAAEP